MMQVKTTKKVSRSAVATVLATSSVALGLPAQSNAAEFFKDVKPTDFYYTAVNELAEQKIVSGYGDGTFRPTKQVTRGEAAKMLALSLKLNVANAETTQFSDVKKGDMFYRYIAALANKGIINGYPDGSFKPNEVVQRGAMAKMVTLGYEFTLATTITHPFKDVSSTNIFNQHIQTLVNLDITKGTSFNTFAPGKAVTRGELAEFISRANKANAGKPVYVVNNIVGNKIYINSVGYTIGSSVAGYIKADNKSALIGAHIEGTFNGTTLTNITKLTLNATGNPNSVYSFDGGNSTFNGTLVVNGSYLKFKNWTLNGQTIVSETPRKSLAQYNRLNEIFIPSLRSGFIDFTKPTNPDDGILNGGSNGGSLNPGTSPSPNAPYSEKLSPINKYVDFTNVTVKNLFVQQNRAYVAAQKEIATVTIRRDVEFAELNFNMRNLYLEGDESLTLYGTHDIATVYKNSLYSVFFNTNSEIGTMIVDNSNGWINLGDYVYVDKVIIPPKTSPNDIFDDYKNDTDKIGDIEDNTGGEVDRNPVEDGIVPDVTRPIVHSLTVVPDSNQATATLTVNETGKYYYLVLPESAAAPTVREIVMAQGGFSGNGTVSTKISDDRYTATFAVSGLEAVTKYTMYVVHVDDAGNFSAKQEQDFETKDGTPPQFLDGTDAKALPGGKRIQLDYRPSEPGKLYYIVRKYGSIDDKITAKDIIDGHEGSPITVDAEDVQLGDFIKIYEDELGDELIPETPYMVYAALVDVSGNPIRDNDIFKKSVITTELDEESPYVTGPDATTLQQLIPVSGTLNQFYMYFNEKLDKVSAEKVENYSLSGTGIINIPGQLPIQPTSVKYEDYQKDKGRVLITIPSLTGFIHNDTLRVTVSENVMDLAENKFESQFNPQTNIGPRNFAQYTHKETGEVIFKVDESKITRNESKNLAYIPYETNKAGQIYYMLVPRKNKSAMDNVHPNDFIAEFNNPNNSKLDGLYVEGSKKIVTSELGAHELTYDYTLLKNKIEKAETYILYMVFRDRSGNLSTKQSALVITDDVPPVISGFNVSPTEGSDTSVKVGFTSSEPGRVRIGYFEKYVQKNGQWVLNDKIYDSSGNLKVFGGDYTQGNDDNLSDFDANVSIIDVDSFEAGPKEIEIKNLKPNIEYVFYTAALDEFENFTVYQSDNITPMIKEVYTDGIAPKIKDNIIYKNPDGTFKITFTESILRKYQDMTVNSTASPNGPTQTTELNRTNWSNYLTIQGITDALSNTNFVFESYTEGTTLNSESVLKLKPVDSKTEIKSFTVTMNDDALDQTILNGNKFINNSGKYIYRTLPSLIDVAKLDKNMSLADYYEEMTIVIDFTSEPAFEDGEWMNLYYKVIQGDFINGGTINKPKPEDIISEVNAGSIGSLAIGKVANITNLNGRKLVLLNHPAGFKVGDYVYVVLEDKYGNRNLIEKEITLP